MHSFYRWTDYVSFYSRGNKIKIGSSRILCWRCYNVFLVFVLLEGGIMRLLITTVVIALKDL